MIEDDWRSSRLGPPGRLEDFLPLLPAEEKIIAHLASGDLDRLGDGALPAAGDRSRAIRAEFLRFLLLGGDFSHRPHEKGIRLSGALIVGMLDLEACRLYRDVGLKDCRFEAAPVLNSAIVERLFLDGSWLPGLYAERLDARGGLYLRGSIVDGEVRLLSARFGGNVECDGATLRFASGQAFNAEGIEARNILFRGASIAGGVDLAGAVLAADLDLGGVKVTCPDAMAVNGGALSAGGSVILQSAAFEGEVCLLAAKIGGDLNCTGAHFANTGNDALQMSRATIAGAFFLQKGAVVDGTLAMTGSTIGSIHDDAVSWPKPGNLVLNRCLYGAFIDGPVDAVSRLDWLSRQGPDHSGDDFWPQPYEQVASVLREMGHEDDAQTILIAKERLQREARRRGERSPVVRGVLAVIDSILKVTVGYGRRPLLALGWILVFWVVGVGVFWFSESQGAFRPNSPVILRSPEWTLCGLPQAEQRFLASTQQLTSGRAAKDQTQLSCFRDQWEAASYPVFNPLMYSLDTLLPVLELDQRAFWSPDPTKPWGRFARAYFYFQSIIGWTLSLLAVAGFSGLVRSR